MGVAPGFRPERLLTLRLSLPPDRYDEPAVVTDFFRRLPERLRGLPGVESVTAVSTLPVTPGESYGEVSVEGAPPFDGRPAASFRRVLPGYFAAMGIPILQGRDFDDRDDGRGGFVVIVNRGLAQRLWPGQDPIGRRMKVGPVENEPWLTVVGVVGDVRHAGLDADVGLATFEPHAQRPRSTMRLAVRTGAAPGPMAPAVVSALRTIEPQLVIDELETMEERIRDSVATRRFRMTLLAAFAAVALLLAGVGVYGVTAYSVAERTREIGIRMALGARPGDVLRLVLSRGAALTGAGLAIGLAGAWALSGFLKKLLFGVNATDPPTLTAVALVLVAVALLACLLPARQAARGAPADVLRHE
jgi:predicted permease